MLMLPPPLSLMLLVMVTLIKNLALMQLLDNNKWPIGWRCTDMIAFKVGYKSPRNKARVIIWWQFLTQFL